MSPKLPAFVDERFLNHRQRASSLAGFASVTLALLLFLYRFLHDRVFSVDLFAVAMLFVVVKYVVFFLLRTRE